MTHDIFSTDPPKLEKLNVYRNVLPSKGAAVMIPPLLFAKAGLQGPLANFILSKGIGTEKLAR
jgi:hypothetical protein